MSIMQIYAGLFILGISAVLSVSAVPVQAAEWTKTDQGWKYQEDDGIYAEWQWKQVDKKWYYFDDSGYCVSGWQKIDDGWYYFNENGQMAASQWIKDYYVGTDGRMLAGTWVGNIWVDEEGKKDTSIQKEKTIPLKSITLNKESISLLAGETANLVTNCQPADTTRWKAVRWSSSDPQVAEVFRGKITAVGEGTAQITAKLGEAKAVCTVTVKESDVCKTALSLLDAQYIWGGNGPADGGVDCSGLLMYAYTQNGYDFGADLNANNFALHGQEISREELQPGDAICCCYNGERYQHILLYIGNDMVVASECGGPQVCTAGLSCDQHVKGTLCNCRTWKRPLNENDLVNAKFIRMDAYKKG